MSESKKQIGWKLKTDRLLNRSTLQELIHHAYGKSHEELTKDCTYDELLNIFSLHENAEHKFSFAVTSPYEWGLSRANLLQKYFEPVYENKGKIIGYKLPIDIRIDSGMVPKGHTFVINPTFPDYYIPNNHSDPYKYRIPKEIVRTWEPVYEEIIELVVGTCNAADTTGHRVIVKKGTILVDGDNEILYGDVCELLETLFLQPKKLIGSRRNYDVVYKVTTKVGCTEVDCEDLRKIINAYKKLNF